MMSEAEITIRLKCLEVAGRVCGESTPQTVRDAAQVLFDWVMKNEVSR
jgi:hypothetical protein